MSVKFKIMANKIKPKNVEEQKESTPASGIFDQDGELVVDVYETESDFVRGEIEKFMRIDICDQCQGSRLKKEALSVTVGENTIAQISSAQSQIPTSFYPVSCQNSQYNNYNTWY